MREGHLEDQDGRPDLDVNVVLPDGPLPHTPDLNQEDTLPQTPILGVESWTVVRRTNLAGGVLEIVRMSGDRMLRVWLPPGT